MTSAPASSMTETARTAGDAARRRTRLRVAYLDSCYPSISHTFVMREIMALRKAGVLVDTFSIRTPGSEQILSRDDHRERDATCYILPPRWGAMFGAHLRTFLSRPHKYLATLAFALGTRPAGFRAALWHLFYFIEAVFLWDRLRRREIHHLHVHFAMACATVAMITAHLGDLTYSLTTHGPTVFFNIDQYLVKQKVEHASHVHCISDFCRSQIMAHVGPEHWSKLHIVHCGVNTDAYAPAPRGEHDPAAPRLLCVGRLVPEKAQSLLIRAVARLADEFPGVACTFVGDGPDRPRLEALCRDLGVTERIKLAGSVSQDEIQNYYDAADLFVLPSFAEGVPVVLMEAMAKEIPVISTRIAGIAELIEEQACGLLVPPGNLDALVEAIRRLLEDSVLRDRLAAAGRQKVVSDFNMERIGRQIGEILHARLGGGSATEGEA